MPQVIEASVAGPADFGYVTAKSVSRVKSYT